MAKKKTNSTKKTARTSSTSSKREKTKKSFKFTRTHKVVFGSFLILFGVALLVSFTSFLFHWKADQSILLQLADRQVQAENWLSKFGAGISNFFIYEGFGIAAYSIAVLIGLTGVYLFFDLNRKPLWKFWFWGLLVMIWVAVFFGFFSADNALLSGVIGFEINDFIRDYIGFLGTALLLLFVFVSYLAIRFSVTPELLGRYFSNSKKEVVEAYAEKKKEHTPVAEPPKTPETTKEVTPENKNENSPELNVSFEEKEKKADHFVLEGQAGSDVSMEVETTQEEELTDDLSNKLIQDFGEFDPTLELGNYRFPSIELLKDYNTGGITINQEELEENKNNIVNTLKNYKIEISQIKATVGPTVTLYEIVPEAGVRISKIKNLEDDIALSLSALGIRIIAPIPGKGTIGIEVPNKNPSIVAMRSVIASTKFQHAEMELPVAIGKTISNETFVVDLAKMPHLLMAGATGQGKSVGLNAILTSLLYKKHPAEVKFVLVDPKKVELTLFNKIERHYLAKLPDTDEAIITDNTKVINTLNSLCIEMDKRYDMLKDAMVRNIKEYNAKFRARKLNPENGHAFLPYIVLVVDEFADLIMTAGKEVETPIARLAQLARAIGIHLIIATQRPSVNVITGMIKANFPARIAFRVTSKIDSRTILDSGGADQLIGRGDMLYTQGNDLVRLQCAFVDTPEIEKITDYIGSQKAYPDAHQLPEYVGEEGGTGLAIDVSERDKKFREAAEIIVVAQQGSASLLQRKLKLGYNRAGRIIDQLEAAGIVGPFEGSKARQVLITDLVALDDLLNNGG